MRLAISRDQAPVRGMLGGNKGVNFSLEYRLILSDEEMDLVETYKLWDYAVTFTTANGSRMPDDTIRNMAAGRRQTVSDVTTLMRNEEIVKDACDSLFVLFEVMESFGGSEVIDYPRPAD